MSTPGLMRRLGPEFKSDDAEQGFSDELLQEWLDDADIELGDGAAGRFGKRYDKALSLAALHMMKMAARTESDTRQDAGGTGLVGAISSVSVANGMNFTARDMIKDAPAALKARWGQTTYGEQLIGLYMETEKASVGAFPDIIMPCF